MASEFCERALKKLRVVGTGRSMTAEQSTDMLAMLNSMLALWSADDLLIPYRTRETLSLTAGTNPHTIGTGGTLNTTQPMDIHEITLTSGGTRYPLTSMSMDEYHRVPDPTISTLPERYCFERGLTTGSIYFDYTPDSAYSAELVILKPFTGFAALTTDDDLPNEYEVPIVFNLAVYGAADWGKEVSQSTMAIAEQSLATIRRNVSASRVPKLQFPAELRPHRGFFNIDSYE